MPAPIAQASAVPYRRNGGRVEFCLVTSTRKGAWGFPKGIIEPGDTPAQTVHHEAEEEAGIRGRLDPQKLGAYRYSKWGTTLHVTAFLMEVTEVDDDWPEAHLRERRWCPADEARRLIGREDLLVLLEVAVARLEGGEQSGGPCGVAE